MKKQRKILVSSLIMILTCCLLFAGSTFAWFSDSVTSNNNVITAGNLDVEVEYTLDGENWANLQGADDLFQKSLWEPGHTEVVALRIVNKGSLAFKYTANLNVVDETVGKTKDGKDIVLSEHLVTYKQTQQVGLIGDIFVGLAFQRRAGEGLDLGQPVPLKDLHTLNADRIDVKDEGHYVILSIQMPSTVGNEANHDGIHVPSITFGIEVVATQVNYEEDSFGSDYDKEAVVYANNATELVAAAADAKDGRVIALNADINESVSFDGDVNFTLDLNGHRISGDSDALSVTAGAVVTIKNGTLESNGYNCGGIYVKNATATLENCILVGTNTLDSCGVYASNGSKVTINNCNLQGEKYGLIMMSADVVINSAVINAPTAISSNGSDAYDKANLTINDGTFNGGIYWPAQGKLTINGGSFTADTNLYVKSGSVEINGGIFVATGAKVEFAYKDSGSNSTGDAIVIENVGTGEYQLISSVVINGGTFSSMNADAVASYSTTDNRVVGFIKGGTFNAPVASDLYAE